MKITHISTTEKSPWQLTDISTSETSQRANLKTNGQTHQSVKGFGGCFNELGQLALEKMSDSDQQTILQELFGPDGCDFNFCRLPIGASDYAIEWYSLNEVDGDYEMKNFSIERDLQYLIPYIKRALEIRDIEFFSSPWSPPTWMKTHKVCNHGVMRWEEKVLQSYCLYFEKYVRAYHEQGINVTQIHVQNEPVSDQKFPSCVWTGDRLREFIGKFLGPHFEKENVPADIWLGTINGPETDERKTWTRYDDYANNVLTDEDACKYVKGVSYQWAGKYAIQQTHLAWPQMPLIQSENECGDGKNTWDYAMYIWELIQHYFTNGVEAYIYWNMILPEGGNSSWGWRQNSMVTVDEESGKPALTHEFHIMKHLARYVKPGAKRLGLSGPWTSNALAFENPDGSRIVALSNPFKNQRELNFEIDGKIINVKLEPRSINTIVIEN